jgi:hypothetical protein
MVNLFILSNNHTEIAEMMFDKHIPKILLEAVQLLSTAKHILDPTDEINNKKIYKITHIKHPVSIWVRKSFENYIWTLDLCDALQKEFNYRFNHNKIHKSYLVALHLRTCIPPRENFEYKGLTRFALAMPDIYKTNDVIKSYRQYYQSQTKKILASWKKRPVPYWYDLHNDLLIDISDYFYNEKEYKENIQKNENFNNKKILPTINDNNKQDIQKI